MEHAIVWQRPVGYHFTVGHHPICQADKIERAIQAKTSPIDFAYELPVAKGGARCQSVVRLHSTIRLACLQAGSSFEICTSVFLAWRPFPG
jgi:hypothetical protein